MKKIFFYCFIMIAFLFFVTDVNAEIFDYSMSKGQEVQIDFSYYEGVSCDDTDLYYLKYESLSADSAKIVYNSTTYPTEENYYEFLNCTYALDLSNPGAGAGDLMYKLHIHPYVSSIRFDLIKGKYDEYNLFVPPSGYTNVIPSLKKIISLEEDEEGADDANDYITINCPENSTSTCSFKVKGSFPEDKTEGLEASYILKYEDKYGDFNQAYIGITVFPSLYVYANAGTYGVCSFNRDWLSTNNAYEKKTKLEVNKTVTLPNCDASKSNNPLLEFAGWVDVSGAKGGPDAQTSDLCVSHLLPSNTVTLTDETRDFVTCYKSSYGVVLNLGGGEFSLPSGSIEKDEFTYVKTSTDRFVLPAASKIPAIYDTFGTGEFKGWENESGTLYTAGDSVPANGDYYFAVFDAGVDTSELYNKFVYENDKISILSAKTMMSCESSDEEYATAVVSNNECIITGVKETAGEYIDVFMTFSDGDLLNYKVRVDPLDADYGFEDFVDLSDILDFTVHDEGEASEVTILGVNTCNTYKVTYNKTLKKEVANYWYSSGGYRKYLNILEYKAESNCNGAEHIAMCMDPGLKGPDESGWYQYEIDTSFNPNNNFGKMVRHLVKIIHADNSTDTKVAANMALRIIQQYANEDVSAGNDHKANRMGYVIMGETLRKTNYCGTNIANCSKDKISAALNAAWNWPPANTHIRDKIADYLYSYDSSVEEVKFEGIDGYSDITEINASGSGLQIVYDGYATFKDEAQMNTFDIKYYCPSGVYCALKSNSKSGNRWDFRMEVYVDASNIKKVSTAGTAKPAIRFEAKNGTLTAANVFVIKPTAGKNYQRMVIFNITDAAVNIPLEGVSCNIFRTSSFANGARDIPACLQPHNTSNFNITLFKELGCCEIIVSKPGFEEFHEDYCSNICHVNNFDIHCNPNRKVGSNSLDVDTYTIKEGYIGNRPKYSCVVDVTNNKTTSKHNTNNKLDFNGNKYAVFSNDYCAISCREEWDLSLPSFNSFTRENAVLAGTYFAINTPIFISSEKQCYTSYIDYASYIQEQQNISKEMVTDFNVHSEYTRVYSDMLDSSNRTTETNYVKLWYSTGSFKCHSNDGCARRVYYTGRCCSGSGENRTCRSCTKSYCAAYIPCSHTCYSYSYNTRLCTMYKINRDYTSFNSYQYSSSVDNYYATVDQKITNGAVSLNSGYNLKYTSGYIGSSNTSRATANGSSIKSYFYAGSRPSMYVTPSQASSYNGICCGKETYRCGGDVVDYSDLIDYTTYRSYNFSTSGGLKSVISSRASNISSKSTLMVSKAKEMSKCQNFGFKGSAINETKDKVTASDYAWNNGNIVSNIQPYYGVNSGRYFSKVIADTIGDSGTTRVESKFVPTASYQYEEYYFMDKLSNDKENGLTANRIVPIYVKDSGNDLSLLSGASELSNGSCRTVSGTNAYGESLQLCRKSQTMYGFNPTNSNPWRNDVEGRNYGGTNSSNTLNSSMVTLFTVPLCDKFDSGTYTYNSSKSCQAANSPIFKLHFITKILKNSNYFVNKGSWYIDTANDIKGHAKNIDSVYSILGNSGMNKDTTALFGQKYNTFPVSLNTPRNYYQYTYSFINIGHFANGDPNRIMGSSTKSMVKINNRACFYEVIEDSCICCGDPIVYLYTTSKVEDSVNYLNREGKTFNKSNIDKNGKYSSKLAISNSTVSLNDLGGLSDQSNWGSRDVFLYEGSYEYRTNKGAELKTAIAKKGENVYNEKDKNFPEYSYRLNPETVTFIRGYNRTNRYGYSSASIKKIGNKVCFNAGITNCNSSEASGYYHMASVFLSKPEIEGAITPEYKDYVKTRFNSNNNTNCLTDNATKIYDNKYNNCRWVDYKEYSNGKTVILALK